MTNVRSTGPSRAFGHALAVCAVLGAAVACGESEDPARYRAAAAKFEPFKRRLEQIRDGLPAPGTEQEKPCAVAIPEQGLEPGDLLALEYFLGKDLDEEITRYNLQSLLSYRPGGSPSLIDGRPRGPSEGALNMELRAERWAEVKHVLVFRASESDLGAFGGKDASGTYVIERLGRWRGWAFVYAFQDPPELVMAFPLSEVSDDEMMISLPAGYAPGRTEMMERIAIRLRKEAFARIAACPAQPTR